MFLNKYYVKSVLYLWIIKIFILDNFILYFKLGLNHVLDILAYDHVLFIIVLTIVYNFNQWKKVVWLITFFTIGHSITLGLAAFNLLNIPLEIVEFLIPVTICTTGFFNILKTSSPTDRKAKNLVVFWTIFWANSWPWIFKLF